MSERDVFKRACDLARTGRHRGLSTIERVLRDEGFTRGQIEEHFFGLSARKTIRGLCRSAQVDGESQRPLVEPQLTRPA